MNNKNKKKQSRRYDNPFETAYETVKDAAKSVVKETFDALNPLGVFFSGEAQRLRKEGKNDFSDIDVQKLNKAYAKDDKEEIERIQRILNPEAFEEQDAKKKEMEFHKRVQREEEQYNLKKQQEEEERKRQEAMEEQQKREQEEEERVRAQQQETPKGKVRKSILGGKGNKKATSEIPAEFRPGAGKQ